MNYRIVRIVGICLLICSLTLLLSPYTKAGESPTPEEITPPTETWESAEPLSTAKIHSGELEFLLDIEEFTYDDGERCHIVQGGCTDGEYYYVGLIGEGDTDSKSAIRKYSLATSELVATYEGLYLSHCNDMTVNTDTRELIAVHNTPDLTNISILDLDTMRLKEVKTLAHEVYGIAYDPYESCYWIGISRGYNFARLDLEFNRVGDIYRGVNTGFVKQGMDVDEDYIYFLQHKDSCVMAYDKGGEFVKRINISLSYSGYKEPENICHVGDSFYIGYYHSVGGKLYETEFLSPDTKETDAVIKEFLPLRDEGDENMNVYNTLQGGCSDGRYLYLAQTSPVGTKSTAILKIDLYTSEVVSVAKGLSLGIANDLTYNKRTGEVIIFHGASSPDTLTVFDPEAMQIKEEKKLDFGITSIAYDETTDGYFVGLAGGYDFLRLGADLKPIGERYRGQNTSFVAQSLECDGEYLYFLSSDENAIAIYETDGSFVNLVMLPQDKGSAQTVFKSGDAVCVGLYVPFTVGEIYKCKIEITE